MIKMAQVVDTGADQQGKLELKIHGERETMRWLKSFVLNASTK